MRPIHVFSGLIMIIVGSLIIVYDYPQLEYLKNREQEKIERIDTELMVKYHRLQTEFALGVGVLVGGGSLILYGVKEH